MAGWQRGGFLAERVLWIAVGVVLVVAAHLLPALIRAHGWRVRLVGVLLWIGCMAATCYGHAVDAIDTEATEAKRQEAAQDRADAARAAAVADPVTGAVTAFGIQSGRVDLLAGLAFAAVLEAVACFCWLLAVRPVESLKSNTGVAVTPVTVVSHAVTEAVIESAPPVVQPVIEAADDVTRVTAEIAAGRLRATVNDIRKYLGCSQSRAAAVRKQLSESAQPTLNQ